MIRKAVIVVLTLGAVGTLLVFTLTLSFYFGYHGSRATIACHNGGVSVLWNRAETVDAIGSFWTATDYDWHEVPVLRLPMYAIEPSVLWLSVPLPLLFLGFIAFPAIGLTRGPRWRWCERGKYMAEWLVFAMAGIPKHKGNLRWKRRTHAVPAFPFFVFLVVFLSLAIPAAYTVEWCLDWGRGAGAGLDALTRVWGSEKVALAVELALTGVLACLPARLVFLLLAFSSKVRDWRLCQKCDYDLTGNVSGVCSECGANVE